MDELLRFYADIAQRAREIARELAALPWTPDNHARYVRAQLRADRLTDQEASIRGRVIRRNLAA